MQDKIDGSEQSHLFRYILNIETTEMEDEGRYAVKVGNKSSECYLHVDEGKC